MYYIYNARNQIEYKSKNFNASLSFTFPVSPRLVKPLPVRTLAAIWPRFFRMPLLFYLHIPTTTVMNRKKPVIRIILKTNDTIDSISLQ